MALNESMTEADFWSRYYAHQDTEDLPGDDSWSRYIVPRYTFQKLTTQVQDGYLDVAFECASTFACTVSAILIFPEALHAQATAFFAEMQSSMRADYDIAYSQYIPTPSTSSLGSGLVVFQRDVGLDVAAFDGPLEGDMIVNDTLLPVRLAPDTLVPVAFSLKAASDSSARLMSAVVGGLSVGMQATVHVVRYKQRRLTADGSVYAMEPLLLVPVPTQGLSLANGLVRRLWIELKMDSDAMPSSLPQKVQITLSFSQGPSKLLNLPIMAIGVKLPIPDQWLGYLGFTPTYPGTVWPQSSVTKQLNETRPSARLLRHYGTTALTGGLGGPVLRGRAANGSVLMDFTAWDRSIAIAQEFFPGVPINTYAGGTIVGVSDNQDITDAVRATAAHNARRNWPQMFLNIADEPQGAAIAEDDAKAAAVAAAGAPQRCTSSAFTSFTSASDPHTQLLNHTSLIILNEHSSEAVDLVRKRGRRWMLYNAGTRFKRGFYMYRLRPLGCLGHYQFAFSSVHADPYYALDSRAWNELLSAISF